MKKYAALAAALFGCMVVSSAAMAKARKAIVGSLAAFGFMTVAIGVAHAGDFTPARQVTVVWQYNSGDGFIYLQGFLCPFGNDYFVIARNGSEHETLMKMMLEAEIARKNVVLGYAQGDDGLCHVSSAQVLR